MELIDRWKEILLVSFEEFLSTLGSYLPSVFGALALLIFGVLVAWFCRWLILRLGQGIDQFTHRFAISTSALPLRWSITRILANIVYWLILLFFVTAAAESLGLPGIAEWLGQFIVYLPSLLIALLIVWLGFMLGNIVRDQVVTVANKNELVHAAELGASARVIVIALTIVIGLSQIGIHIQLVEHLLVVMAAAVVISLALAFALGAGPAMANVIAVGNVKQRYQVGDRVSVKEVDGMITAFSRTAVIIDTGSGLAMVPARVFQENVSFLHSTDEGNDES